MGDATETGPERLVEGARCAGCGTLYFPAPTFCMSCYATDIRAQPLSRTGKLYAFSTIHVGAPRFPRPYTVGYADLPEGLRLFGRLDGAIALDAPVEIYEGRIGQSEDGEPVRGVCFRALEGAA